MSTGEPKNRKPVAVAALLFDKLGRVLLVKPTYKNHWGMPGGAVELGESPIRGCVRELKEELALDFSAENLKLVCVDYINHGVTNSWGDAFRFVFYAGVLDDETISKIKIPAEELEKIEFVEAGELPKRLSDHTSKAITRSVEALKAGVVIYLEDGLEVR